MPVNISKSTFKPVKPRLAMKLHYLMHGHQKARSAKWVHASDITDSDFCAREFALIWRDRPKAKRPGMNINTSLRYTFDMGVILADALVERWGVSLVHGIWKCQGCGIKTLPFSPKPEFCQVCQKKEFKHKERYGTLFGKRYTYAPDMYADLGEEKLRVVELKTIKADDFKELKGPLAKHSLRTAFYMDAIEREGLDDKIYTDEGIVLYLCKGYGFKDDKVMSYGIGMDKTTPFKEYSVHRKNYQEEIDATFKVIEGIARVTNGKPDPIIPSRIKSCDALECKRAKSCPVSDICWSMP